MKEHTQQRGPSVNPLGRFARGRRLDRNPLRRASDVIETAVQAVLIIAFAAGAPFAAQASGAWIHGVARHAQIAQETSRSLVPATLLAAAPGQQGRTTVDREVRARWTAPDGKERTGEIIVLPGTAAGATVKMWVTRDGALSSQPLRDSQVAGQTGLAEVVAVVGLAVLLADAGLLARRLLDKHRMAEWSADWRATGPRWTTRA